MKRLFLTLFITISVATAAQKVEVSADSFFADENAGYGDLKGSVEIKKGDSDKLWASEVRIRFDKSRVPISYEASGGARFEAVLNGKKYSGSGTVLIYEPALERWQLRGDARIKEEASQKEVFGEEILVNQAAGTYSVKSAKAVGQNGKNEPVRMIFSVEQK